MAIISLVGTASITVDRSEAAAATRPASATVARAAGPAAEPAEVVWAVEDVATALAAAARQHFRVEITSARSQDSTTYANPDGTFTTDVSSGPIRVRDADAATGWAPLDLTLRRNPDGTVAAVSHPDRLTLSGSRRAATSKATKAASGASRALSVTAPAGLALLDAGKDQRVGLGWNGTLPTPTLSGSRATYHDVRPHMDLVVQATATGFEQFFILRERPADTSFTVSLPLSAQGLTPKTQPDGSIAFAAADGRLRGGIPAPTAWDASVNPQAGQSTNTSRVGMALSKDSAGQFAVALTPDAAWLADPATRYPVTIDPATTIKPYSDTWVESDYASAQVGSPELRIGTYDGGKSVARSFLSFNTAAFDGTAVSSATLSLYEFHSWSCSPRAWQVWETGAFTASTTWKNQPSWTKQWASASTAKGYTSACKAGVDAVSVTGLAKKWATQAGAVRTIGLRAGSESDNFFWKKFNSANAASHQPTLSVTYNSYPKTAGTPAHTPGTVSATATTGWTTTATPTLKATVSDPDGGKVKALFDVYNGSTLVVNHLAGSAVASGGTSTAVVPAGKLVNGVQYVVRAWSNDGTLTSAAWSAGYDRFTVDTAAPSAPAVSSSTFPANTWTNSSGLGSDGKAHFSAKATSADARTLQWSLDASTVRSSAAVAGTATTVDLALAAPAVGRHTLNVRTLDNAGNVGATNVYTFFYGDGPLAGPPAAVNATAVDESGLLSSSVDLILNTTPTLNAFVGPNVGSAVTYDFEIWDSTHTTRTAAATVPDVADGRSASWTVPAATIDATHDYTYRARGRIPTQTGPWSTWRRLVNDMPDAPTQLSAARTDTDKPVLSAVAYRPSGRPASLRFYLWNGAGKALGASPLGEVDAVAGTRTAVALPSGLVHPGETVQWAASTCVGDVCSAQSARQTLTATAAAAPTTVESRVTAPDWAAAQIDSAGCDDGTCPLQAGPVSIVDADEPIVAFTRFTSLDAIPAGAEVTSARLVLSAPDCGGDCSGKQLNAFPIMENWPDPADGEQLFAGAQTDDGASLPVSNTGIDVTDLVSQWLDDPTTNGGLAFALEPGTNAVVHYAGAPTLVVNYVPAAAPGAPRNVSARAGDAGVLVNWEPGAYGGTDPEQLTYTVTVTNTVTGAATPTTVPAGPVVVHRLANGQPYTVSVTATSAGATSAPSSPQSFTPAAPAGGADYLAAVKQFHSVTDAPPAAGADPATSLTGLSQRSAISAAVLARSAVAGRSADILRRHDTTPATETWTVQDTLVSSAGNSVVVRAVGTSVDSDDAPADEPDEESDETSESALVEDFFFVAGSLTAVVDAAGADLIPNLDSGTVTDLDPPAAGAVALAEAADDPQAVLLDDDGMPVMGTPDDEDPAGGTRVSKVNSNGIDHAGVARYAVKHAYDKPPRVFRDDDCTDFASKALHTGGKLPFRYGWYRNNKHWWSNSLNRTFSWGAVVNLSEHLGYRGVSWVKYFNWAKPGDILFWKYREWSKIGHTSVVTKMSGGNIYYSQHSGPRKNRSLNKQLAELNAQGHGPVSIYIARLGNR